MNVQIPKLTLPLIILFLFSALRADPDPNRTPVKVQWILYLGALEMEAQKYPADLNIPYNMAVIHSNMGDTRKVLQYINKAKEAGLDSIRAFLLMGDHFFRLKNYDLALKFYLKVLTKSESQPHALLQIWKIIITLERHKNRPLISLGGIKNILNENGYFLSKQIVRGTDPVNKAKELLTKAMAFYIEKNYFQAIEQYMAVLSHHPYEPEAFRGLGLAYLQLGQTRKAIGALRLYTFLKPEAEDLSEIQKAVFKMMKPDLK